VQKEKEDREKRRYALNIILEGIGTLLRKVGSADRSRGYGQDFATGKVRKKDEGWGGLLNGGEWRDEARGKLAGEFFGPRDNRQENRKMESNVRESGSKERGKGVLENDIRRRNFKNKAVQDGHDPHAVRKVM